MTPPGVLRARDIAGIALVSILLAGFVAGALNQILPWRIDFGFVGYLVLGAFLLGAASQAGVPSRRLWGGWPGGSWISASVGVGMGALILAHLEAACVAPNPLSEYVGSSVASDAASLRNILSIASAVVLGPVIEEWIFRGLLLQRWTSRFGLRTAVLASSLLFGVLHEGVLSATLMGIACCILYVETQSLWCPIALHVANNALSYLVPLMPASAIDAIRAPFALAPLLVASGLVMTLAVWRLTNQRTTSQPAD